MKNAELRVKNKEKEVVSIFLLLDFSHECVRKDQHAGSGRHIADLNAMEVTLGHTGDSSNKPNAFDMPVPAT